MRKAPFIRSPYNYDVEEASNAAMIPADQQGESLTVQSQMEDADINVMMKRMGVAYTMPEGVRIPSYGDFSEVRDFRSALDAVFSAQDEFMKMPAEVRTQFDNDPQKFLDFAVNPGNLDALGKLGLAVKKETANDNRDQPVREVSKDAGVAASAAASGAK